MKKYLRIHDVTKMCGIARSTVYFWIRRGLFPRPIKLGERVSVWSVEEIEDWIQKRRSRKASSEV